MKPEQLSIIMQITSIKCPLCKLTFITRVNLRVHLHYGHSTEEAKKYLKKALKKI